jgi:hypothetical protein
MTEEISTPIFSDGRFFEEGEEEIESDPATERSHHLSTLPSTQNATMGKSVRRIRGVVLPAGYLLVPAPIVMIKIKRGANGLLMPERTGIRRGTQVHPPENASMFDWSLPARVDYKTGKIEPEYLADRPRLLESYAVRFNTPWSVTWKGGVNSFHRLYEDVKATHGGKTIVIPRNTPIWIRAEFAPSGPYIEHEVKELPSEPVPADTFVTYYAS